MICDFDNFTSKILWSADSLGGRSNTPEVLVQLDPRNFAKNAYFKNNIILKLLFKKYQKKLTPTLADGLCEEHLHLNWFCG